MDDERVVKLANRFYRDHVGIPMDHFHNDQNLFKSLDQIGQINLEENDQDDGEH